MELYLSSYDYKDFNLPRKVTWFEKIKLDTRNVLVVDVDCPLIGQKYGLLDIEVSRFYLINRVDENAFDTLKKFPIDVHVLIVKDKFQVLPTSLFDLQNIAWACIYDNESDAINHVI